MTYGEAVANAKKHLEIQHKVAHTPPGMAICFDTGPRYGFSDPRTRWCLYCADAWERPAEAPMLPWKPPPKTVEPREWLKPDGTLVPWTARKSVRASRHRIRYCPHCNFGTIYEPKDTLCARCGKELA